MLGIIPAAGGGERLQPWVGAKELLPLGRALDGPRAGRLRVVSEYLIERMLLAGADRLCLILSGAKTDLLRFYAASEYAPYLFFVVQPRPRGLCDAVFRALPHVRPGEPVLIGLPDTVWYPREALGRCPADRVHLITFPVAEPEHFDAVIPASANLVARVEVKRPGPPDRRVWGAITLPGAAFIALERLWRDRGGEGQFLGDLFNAWLAAGHPISFDRQGEAYWDIGTPAGYERALADAAWRPPRLIPTLGNDHLAVPAAAVSPPAQP